MNTAEKSENIITATPESAQIANTFEAKTGVNLEDYRRPEIVEMVANIISFPLYAGKFVVIPLGIYLLITFLIIFLVEGDLATLLAIIFVPVFSISNALATAAIPFVFRLRSDMSAAVSAGLGLTKEVSHDLRNIQLKKKNDTLEFPGFAETFKAVMKVVMVPVVVAVVKKKIPLIGGLFAGLIRRLANLATGRTINQISEEMSEEPIGYDLPADQKEARLLKRVQNVSKFADRADRIVTQSIKWASRLLFIPVFATFAFVLLITVFCYYVLFRI